LEFGVLTQEHISKCILDTGLDETDEAYQLSFNEFSEFADRVDACIEPAKLESGFNQSPGMRSYCNELSLRKSCFTYVSDGEGVYEYPIEFRLLRHWDDCSCGGWRHWMPLFKAEGRWRWDENEYWPDFHR